MAFHQPTRQPTQRVFRPSLEDEEPLQAPRPSLQPVEDPQTWVLFSPATDAGTTTTTSYLTESNPSNITPGRSRFSDLGSLNTADRTEASAGPQNSASLVDAADEDDEDAELDSLDSHLPGFRSTPDFYNSSPPLPHALPVVPAHDGYGSFRLEQEGMGPEIQDRLYAFEQYNPRRVKRRRESLELAQAELENDPSQEMDKMRRIETWRLEQSRYLLEEIQKETRRRRRSAATTSTCARLVEKKAQDTAVSSTRDDTCDGTDQEEDWHDHHANEYGDECSTAWGRITRKVIRDILGIDDKLLAILFGEELPDEEELSTTPTASSWQHSNAAMESSNDSSWQLRMLERVAKELGNLVHQLSGHPGAFSTFSRVQQTPIPYAGLPSIPETTKYPVSASFRGECPISMPEFPPTISAQARPVDVPQGRSSSTAAQSKSQTQTENAGATFTQDEWEQDLDVRLIFRYLRSRFLPRSNNSNGFSTSSHATASSTQDLAAKVARVRQNHPLISRSRPTERRKSKATTPSSPGLYRHASSCASQSTRRSVRKSSVSSSRHYWDIGGSVGTGSMIATIGPMGSWGEV
ncbi:hypothetical protein F5X96DRAFT_341990 [Biscogniauxia mediterranea]|nr:hypothetical protein F5X96DRAFT_341990 [Biscogniauxia mediterranea]